MDNLEDYVAVHDTNNYCKRCGKQLKNIDSKICGYGKVCYEKIQTANHKRLFCPIKVK